MAQSEIEKVTFKIRREKVTYFICFVPKGKGHYRVHCDRLNGYDGHNNVPVDSATIEDTFMYGLSLKSARDYLEDFVAHWSKKEQSITEES